MVFCLEYSWWYYYWFSFNDDVVSWIKYKNSKSNNVLKGYGGYWGY